MARKRKSKGSDNTLLYVGIAVVGFLFLSGGNANANNGNGQGTGQGTGTGQQPVVMPDGSLLLANGGIIHPDMTYTRPDGTKITVDPSSIDPELLKKLQSVRGNLSGLGNVSVNNAYCLY